MALTHIYVDPLLNADSGLGTVGSPFGDLEFAIEQTTFPAGGIQINVKDSADEIVVAQLGAAMANIATTPAWVPSTLAPVVIRGYTAAANDGGIMSLSGGGLSAIYNDAGLDYVFFVDGVLHNTGANVIVDMDNWCGLIRCHLHTTTSNAARFDIGGLIRSCYFSNIGGEGVDFNGAANVVEFSRFANGVNAFTQAIDLGIGSVARFNTLQLGGASDGIRCGDYSTVAHNSVYSAGGAGQGIQGANGSEIAAVVNNAVEGFSGVGGVGYFFSGTNQSIYQYGKNASYDNTAHYSDPSNWVADELGDNEILTASPFVDAANGDFTPVDTGNMKLSSPIVVGGGF